MNYLQTEFVLLFLHHVGKLSTLCVCLFWWAYSYSGFVGVLTVALSSLPFHCIRNLWRYKNNASPEAQTRALQIITKDHALQEVLMVIEPSAKLFGTRIIEKTLSLREHADEILADLTERNVSSLVESWKTFISKSATRDVVIAYTLLISVALLSPLLILPFIWFGFICAINIGDWGADALSTTYIITSRGIVIFVDHEHEQTIPWRLLGFGCMVANESMGWVGIHQHYYIPSNNPEHLLRTMNEIRKNHMEGKRDVGEILDI